MFSYRALAYTSAFQNDDAKVILANPLPHLRPEHHDFIAADSEGQAARGVFFSCCHYEGFVEEGSAFGECPWDEVRSFRPILFFFFLFGSTQLVLFDTQRESLDANLT